MGRLHALGTETNVELPSWQLKVPIGTFLLLSPLLISANLSLEEKIVLLRCILDGLLLPARLRSTGELVAYDDDEGFVMDAVEAVYYEVVAGNSEEFLRLEQGHYRLLRSAAGCGLAPRAELQSTSFRGWAGARSARQC